MKIRKRSLAIRWLAALMLLALTAVTLGSAHAQDAPALKVIAPSDGAAITSSDIPVQVEINNFTVDCAQLGRPDQAGTGQILALVDGTTIAQVTNFYCADTFTIPGDGITPGEHTIAVRATDGTGATQTDERSQPDPNGATGHHTIDVRVE